MRKILKKGFIVLFGLVLIMPMVDLSAFADSRNFGFRSGVNSTDRRPSLPSRGNEDDDDDRRRPGRPHRPSRPDFDDDDDDRRRPGLPHRPSRPDFDDDDDDRHRPGRPHRPSRPDFDDDDDDRRPHRPHRPGRPPRPHYHPGHSQFRPILPPSRPHRPQYCPFYRPVRPPHFRPWANAPLIDVVLGLPFGISFNVSIDRLGNAGYFIDGYSGSEVYLRDVHELGYEWDDAVVRYDGGLMASVSMYHSSRRYSTRRFDRLYDRLCVLYGQPALGGRGYSSLSATWYDRDGRHYVTLSYEQMTSFGGSSRYYTVLTYGN